MSPEPNPQWSPQPNPQWSPQPNPQPGVTPLATTVFWTTFLVVVLVLTAVTVIPQVGVEKTEQVLLLAFGAAVSLVVPAGLAALLVSRPLRVHGERGPLLSMLFALVGFACGVAASLWLRAHPLGADIGLPLTDALWAQLGWVSLVIFPLLLITLMIDMLIRIVWAIAHALAPALVPAFALLGGVLLVWAIAALVIKVARRLRARRAG